MNALLWFQWYRWVKNTFMPRSTTRPSCKFINFFYFFEKFCMVQQKKYHTIVNTCIYKWHMTSEFIMRYLPRCRLLNKVTWDYRREISRWFTLLASILEIWIILLYSLCWYLPNCRLLNKVTWDYRRERWFTLLASILEIWILRYL